MLLLCSADGQRVAIGDIEGYVTVLTPQLTKVSWSVVDVTAELTVRPLISDQVLPATRIICPKHMLLPRLAIWRV